MIQIKDSINYGRDSEIVEQSTTRISVCQPFSRDGMNLTLIFMFDTYRYRFHSMSISIDNTRHSLSGFGESQIA